MLRLLAALWLASAPAVQAAVRVAPVVSGVPVAAPPIAVAPQDLAVSLESGRTLTLELAAGRTLPVERSLPQLERVFSRARARPALHAAPEMFQSVLAGQEPDPPPVRRSLQSGALAGFLTVGLMVGVPVAAQALGYRFESNYKPPVYDGTLGGAYQLVVQTVIQAPILEEAIFRAGAVAYAARLFGKLGAKKWAFPAAAVAASVLFAVGHESHDPVLLGLRIAGALILTRVFWKEGFLAAVAAHAVNNAFWCTMAISGHHLGPTGSGAAALAWAGLGGLAAWKAASAMKKSSPPPDGDWRKGLFSLPPMLALPLGIVLLGAFVDASLRAPVFLSMLAVAAPAAWLTSRKAP